MKRFLASMVLLTAVICSVAHAQLPKAVVTGPKQSRCGAMVILSASESQGSKRIWTLVSSPTKETTFGQFESNLLCVFADPMPGDYIFALVVAGTDANGGPAVDVVLHTVTLIGTGPPNVPPVTPPIVPPVITPDPTLPPLPTRPTAAVYIWEKDETNPPRPVQAALDRLNSDGSGIVASLFEQDTTTGAGTVPAQYRVAVTAAKAAGLPCLVVTAGDRVLRVVKDPKTEADVLEAVK